MMDSERSISRDEALAQLRAIADGTWGEKYDPQDKHWYLPPPSEGSHDLADAILLALIGDDEIREAYNSFPKWYA